MYKLIKLSTDNYEPFSLMDEIGSNENEFKNTAHGMTIQQFKKWLMEQDNWANGKGLPNGYVPQLIYWFYCDGKPIGMGKIRLGLTADSRLIGGNVGYAIGESYRGRGYGTAFLKLLISEAKSLNLPEILLTVEKNNLASKRVVEKVGGKMIKETSERWYFSF